MFDLQSGYSWKKKYIAVLKEGSGYEVRVGWAGAMGTAGWGVGEGGRENGRQSK